MRISDWSSDVCSSDLIIAADQEITERFNDVPRSAGAIMTIDQHHARRCHVQRQPQQGREQQDRRKARKVQRLGGIERHHQHGQRGSEEHTSELQSLMRNSYAVFCLKKKRRKNIYPTTKSDN